jgi:thymidylate synthase
MLKRLAKYNMLPAYLPTNNNIKESDDSNIKISDKIHEEYQYLNLIHDIIETGVLERGRNGVTKSIFGASMVFSLTCGKIPILTTKKTAWKTCFKELLWFIRGDTNNAHLQKEGVHIWDANGSREFLDSRGLINNREGDLGAVYGHQWRHFNASYSNCDTDYRDQGVDQLQNIIEQLKNPEMRTSRRMIMTAWNPCQLDEMALPPCHILCQFNVHDGNKLSCALYQRSGDVGLGVPFNIASYSAFTHIIAKHCDLEAYEFVYHLGNAHIYEEHIDSLTKQLERTPYEFPRIEIQEKREKIENYKIDDIKISDYKSHESIPMKMIA